MFLNRKTVIRPEWKELLAAQQLDSFKNIFNFDGGVVVRKSGSTEVRRIEFTAGGATRTIYLKKYTLRKLKDLQTRVFRGTFFGASKMVREFRNLTRLKEWGFKTATPVACGEERKFGWLVRSFMMTEGVWNPIPLDEFIRDSLPQLTVKQRSAARRQLIDSLATVLRRLHEHKFVHRDLFWRNIVVGGGSPENLFLIDMPRGQTWRGRGLDYRAQDMAALDAVAPVFFRRSERLRFFLRYAGRDSLGAEGKKLLHLALKTAAPMRKRQTRHVIPRHPGSSTR